MAYNPINFQNTEAGGTPLSASNLNHLEQGIIVANELVPESAGNAGQVLTKTENGTAWQNTQESLPSGGTVGQVLTKTETGSAWQDTDAFPEEGTVGQVLTKSADGVQWTNAGNPTDTQVSTAVTAWLDENVTEIPQTAPIVDTSLTIQGAAADAKKTGDEISDLKSQIAQLEAIPRSVKLAMDTLFQNMIFKNTDVYTDEQAVFHAWATAINLLSISAVFDQGQNAIYDTDSLDSLKQYLTVTASYDDGTSSTVSGYTLSGTLTVGTSTITVTFEDKIATFDVIVTSDPTLLYSIRDYEMPLDGKIQTNVYLNEEDRDYTIAFDINLTQVNDAYKLVWQYENVSPWRGTSIGRANTTSSAFNVKAVSSYVPVDQNAAELIRRRLVVSHANGSGKWNIYYRNGTATTVTSKTLSDTFASFESSAGIMLNGHNTNLWAGYINRFEIRNYAMSATQAREFLMES